VAGQPFYIACVFAAIALPVAALLLRRRIVALTTVVLLLLAISVISVIGVQSSARLADVRKHAGSLRTSDTASEAREIAADWAVVLLIGNVGLAVALVVHGLLGRKNRV
jgi:hypothetical protein